MRNVYFVQVDVSACLGAQNAYLPYTAGILAATAWTSRTVKQHFLLKEFIFLRESIFDVVSRMEDPAIVAFSNYCWNTEYNKALAQAVKKAFPDCLVIFGGHNVPDDFSYLEAYPYIDVLAHGEGEDTLRILFEAIALRQDLNDVPNISFRNAGGTYTRTETVCQRTLEYPSPYLDGWFDGILRDHPEITFNAILETSRGCPNRCAYCDWGLLKAKVRLFPLERIKAEIRWMAEHKIAFVWGADANFGMFSRDLEIADALVEAKETTGFPERMRMNYAKNNYENVFAIVKKFKACEFDRIGATLSFQSMSPVVLENIGRTNRDLEFYKKLLTKYNTEGMKTYSELILGLPGETYESFIAGIGKLFEIGQHFVFEVYGCILLPNAAMGQKDFVEKFGIRTVQSEIIRPHFQNRAFDVPEYNTIVVETASMPREMWVRATAFYYLAKAFHGNGLLRAFAVYLYVHAHVPYERFYDGILDYFEENPELFPAKLYAEIKRHAEEQSLGQINRKLIFDPCGDVVWDDHEYVVLHILEQPERFYADMLPYLRRFGIPEDVFEDLLSYQKAIMRRPLDEAHTVSLSYDVHGFLRDCYVNDVHPLRERRHRLTLRDSNVQKNWPDFGKYVIWYGRMGWSSYKDDVTYEDVTCDGAACEDAACDGAACSE
ncbi:MAG: radical SAM protein [Clostridia bacterium]|nr:radical SAM protein [Clostridia bacterium]